MQTIETKMKKVPILSKGRIIGLSILIFLAVVITGALWYWNTHKKAIIKNKLETAVKEKSNGLYKIKYDSLDMDEMSGYLSVSNMHLSYDSARYSELIKRGEGPSFLLNIDIPEITVSGVKTPRALIENEIVGRKLEIKNPVIDIIYTNSGRDSSTAVPPKEVYEQILGNMDFIKVDTVMITGAQITTGSLTSSKKNIQIQDVSMMLVDVKVDSTSNADTTRILFAREAGITCKNLVWSSGNNQYNYTMDSLTINSVSRHLRIKKLRMVPTLNEDAFVKALLTQDDRFDISVSNIQLKNVSLQQLFKQNIVADSLLIGGFNFKIFRDLAVPRDKMNRVGGFPHQLMQTLPVRFSIEKIVMSDGFIEYKEKHRVTRQSGKVQYYHVYAGISHFTNDKELIAVNNIMTVDMDARFLDKTPLKVSGVFYLLNPKGRYDLKGTFGDLDATLLNPIIERTGLTHIEKGQINAAEFNLKGNDYGIDGRVKILYENLRVAALEKDKGASELDKKSLSSFFVNIIIRNSNPKKNDEVRVAQVHIDRDPNSSFFNFSWKALLKGIEQSVGMQK